MAAALLTVAGMVWLWPSGASAPAAVKAFHAYDALVCQKVDVEALNEFRRRWANDFRSQSANCSL